MKKVALSKMKCAALFAMMFFSYQGMAQNASLYVGDNCKIYPDDETAYSMSFAHLVTDEHNSSAKYLMADKITCIYSNSYPSTTKIRTSEYGNFVEFYDTNSSSFRMHCGSKCFAKNGNTLYFLHIPHYTEEEYLWGIIPLDFEIADDFQIILSRNISRIFIMNNGILMEYTYKDVRNNLDNTSVNSPKVDDKEDATYSLDGKKVQTPHNGIFIKGDKKVMIK